MRWFNDEIALMEIRQLGAVFHFSRFSCFWWSSRAKWKHGSRFPNARRHDVQLCRDANGLPGFTESVSSMAAGGGSSSGGGSRWAAAAAIKAADTQHWSYGWEVVYKTWCTFNRRLIRGTDIKTRFDSIFTSNNWIFTPKTDQWSLNSAAKITIRPSWDGRRFILQTFKSRVEINAAWVE